MDALETQYCSECGKPYPSDDLLEHQGRRICLECKPAFAQRLRQGETAAAGQMEYAGFWIRGGARFIDGIILGVANLAMDALLRLAFGLGAPGAGFALGGGLLIFALNIAIAVLYEAGFLVRNGATPGKMILGLRVVTADGGPISWGRAIARYFAYWLDAITLLVGYIMAAFDSEKRALHDHVCGTRVVRNAAVQVMLTR
jgi:uncharacterized RDD family membrane protein YckC